MTSLDRRTVKNLRDVHPLLVAVLVAAIRTCQIRHGFTVIVQHGIRTKAEQRRYVSAGRSKTMNSLHLPQRDAYSWAADVMPIGDLDSDGDVDAYDKRITWRREHFEVFNKEVQVAAAFLGVSITWGGEWTHLFPPKGDCPHFQLES